MLWKCCTQYASKFGKLSSGHRTGKGQFSFQSPKKVIPKNVQTNAQLHSSQMPAKQCSKFSNWSFNSTWTTNFQMFKLVLEKAEEPEIKLPTSTGSSKKQESSRETSTSAYWLYQNLWLCGSQQTVENSERDGNIWPPYLLPEKSVSRSKQQFEPGMEQQTGSKLGKEYVKAVYCHPAYLTYMQSTSWEMLGWRKHKLESRLPGEISITSNMQMTPPLWQKLKRN